MEKKKLFISGNTGDLTERLPVPVYFENKKWRFMSSILWTGFLATGFLFLLAIVSGVTSNFLSKNLMHSFQHFLLIALPAIPMLVIFANGSVDLSVGAVAMLAGMIAGSLTAAGNPAAGISLSLFIVVCIGAVVGFSAGWLKIPGVFITLVIALAIRGLGNIISNGRNISLLNIFPDISELLVFAVLVLNILIVIAFLWMQLPAWNVRKIKTPEQQQESKFRTSMRIGLPYVVSSLAAGIMGILWISQLQTATPRLGRGFEFDFILIVILSGTVMYSRFGNANRTGSV